MICWYWRLDTALESGADEGRILPLMSAITWDSQAGLGWAKPPLKRLHNVPWGVRSFHECGICSWSTEMEKEVNLHFLSSISLVTKLNTEQFISFILSTVNRFSLIGVQLLTMCVSFCCTTKWISYMYTEIPSHSPPLDSSRSSQSTELSSLCYTAASH